MGVFADKEEYLVKSDTELAGDVTDELFFDPHISDFDGIAVAADGGSVTLRGTVASFHQKRSAAGAARRVSGVTYVNNELQVRLMTEFRREDSDIRAAALQALMLDSLIPAEEIDVKVRDGLLTLTGTVAWQYQSDLAEDDVLPLIGIVDIENTIVVATDGTAVDVADRINGAFLRNAQLNDSDIEVSST